jgi:hypothetical protein
VNCAEVVRQAAVLLVPGAVHVVPRNPRAALVYDER